MSQTSCRHDFPECADAPHNPHKGAKNERFSQRLGIRFPAPRNVDPPLACRRRGAGIRGEVGGDSPPKRCRPKQRGLARSRQLLRGGEARLVVSDSEPQRSIAGGMGELGIAKKPLSPTYKSYRVSRQLNPQSATTPAHKEHNDERHDGALCGRRGR